MMDKAMDELRDRVARWLYDYKNFGSRLPWDEITDVARKVWYEDAAALIFLFTPELRRVYAKGWCDHANRAGLWLPVVVPKEAEAEAARQFPEVET